VDDEGLKGRDETETTIERHDRAEYWVEEVTPVQLLGREKQSFHAVQYVLD
jgi:hypothetical protein